MSDKKSPSLWLAPEEGKIWGDVLRKMATKISDEYKANIISHLEKHMAGLSAEEAVARSTRLTGTMMGLAPKDNIMDDKSTSYEIIYEWATRHKLEMTIEPPAPCTCERVCECPGPIVFLGWP